MSSLEAEQSRVRRSIARLPGWDGETAVIEPALPVLASPSWRGVDGTPWRVRNAANGESAFVKAMDQDAALYIDVPCAFEAASRACALGIGPRVLCADLDEGVLVMEDLDRGWRVGTLERVLDPAIVDAVLAARRRFREGPPLPKRRGVFEEVEHFHAAAQEARAQLPSETAWLVGELRLAADAIRGLAIAPVPIHGDGNVSNILISDAGEIRLIDWDRATTADPLEDIGSFLVEAFAHEPEARDAFTRHTGAFDEAAFSRARLYGIADDLRWGLIGALLAAKSRRNTLEFYKFASWRFARCGMAVREPRFGETLRRLA
ncbi:phosphotransferase [Chelatococcus reniformis]|uniref:Aminoglycoside phosphotransferase n=1 Tax=Chelatococcus reniformis TaxID=1494448 RepID=A0A916XMS6_9HYPH|nr:phosphotransferase [Chelatococcus reniformis]GGC85132.1 aminoglycoside phosphotransferase [Chelatococcus reniformis]